MTTTPPCVDAPAIAKVALVGNRDTRQWVNVFHVHKTSGVIVAADLQPIAQAFYSWWHTFMRAQLPAAILLDVIQVRKLDRGNPLALDYTSNLPEAGSGQSTNDSLLPADATITTSWRTGLAGRKYRGRNYLPALTIGSVTQDDRINSNLIAKMTATALNYIGSINGIGGFTPCIYHCNTGLQDEVISFVIDAIIDSQRRRLPGRGR